MGAALFGYTKLYGQVPGGQAEYLRVPQAQYGPIKVPDGPPDDRFVYCPTSADGVAGGRVRRDPDGGTWSSSGSVRSATWPGGSRCTAGSGDRRRTWSRNGSSERESSGS
jgi:hypothetical protein